MKEFLIKNNEQGQRLDKFLQKAVPLLPKSLMYKYIRIKRIKVNGKKSDISYTLVNGDIVELYINDEFFANNSEMNFLKVSNKIDIIYEDENILLINKKAGLVVHEDNENTVDTLINRILNYLYNKNEYNPDDELSFVPSLCNRIDRYTTGIVIAAKNAESLRVLNQKIKNREVKKEYLCVVSGNMPKKQDTLTAYLVKNENEKLVKVFDKPVKNSKSIITKYRVLQKSNGVSLLEVDLKTGRTHQIRAHLAYIGHPILGDGKYGTNNINRKYKQKHQLLCSYKLSFKFKDKDNILGYLNNKTFEINNIWFRDEFENLF